MEWIKRLFRAFVALTLLGVIVIAAGRIPADLPEENTASEEIVSEGITTEVYEKVLASCVRIQSGNHYGSGSVFSIDENEIIIVANRHVLQYWDDGSYVTFFNGAVADGRVIEIYEGVDVGFLSVYTAFLREEELESIRAIFDSTEVDAVNCVIEHGETFFMIDVASDIWNPTLYEGQILEPCIFLEEFGMDMLYGDAIALPGMSGSGLFDCSGRYIGILVGGTEHSEIAAHSVEVVVNSIPLK